MLIIEEEFKYTTLQRFTLFSDIPCDLLVLNFDYTSLYHTTVAHTSEYYRSLFGFSQRCHHDVINNDIIIFGQCAVDSPSPEVVFDIKLGGLCTLNPIK
jgi:hypothetical protein